MKKNIHMLFVLITLLLFCPKVKGQDLIVKTTGDSIRVKVLEVGINTVTFKKASMPTGPEFVLDKAEIILIRYSNGEVEYYNKTRLTEAKTTATTTANTSTATSSGTTSSAGGKNKIEFINDQYLINGVKAKRKDVNRYLGKSQNPAILLGLKGAKGMSLAQKITKFTSYPTTIVGSVTTLFTVVEGYQLVQRGRATGKTFLNMGLNFVGTISLPITSKILKKKSDKMYDKLIDMYNLTN